MNATDQRTAWPRRAAPILVLVGLSLLAFWNTVGNGFVYDDNAIVAFNPLIKTLHNLPAIFTTGWWGTGNTDSGLYRPLTIATYAVDYALWGHRPFAFHLVNLLLHAGVTVLGYLALRRALGRPRTALVAAMLFAVHPVHVEAVSGIVGRAELLGAGFVLAALLAHLRYRRTARLRYLALASLAYLLALLSKESTVVFPLLPLAVDLAGRGEGAGPDPDRPAADTPRWRPYLVYGIPLAILAALRLVFLGSGQAAGPAAVSLMDNPLYELPAAQRLASALYVLARYLWLLLVPVRLSADYSYSQITPILGLTDARLLVAVAGGLGLTAWAVLSFRRWPVVFLGLALLLAPLLPVSNLAVPIGTIMAERLLYLPALGFCLVAAAGADRLFAVGRRRLTLALIGLILVAYTGRALLRNRDWRSDATLFAAALEVVPNSSRMHLFIGRDHNNNGRYDLAVTHLARSLEILPGNPDAIVEVGNAHLGTGDFEAAEHDFRQAVQMDPDHVGGYYGLGCLYMQQGQHDAALDAFLQCVERSPLHIDARVNIGIVEYTLGDLEEAEAVFRSVLALDPTSLACEYFLGRMERERGDAAGAVRRFERVIAAAKPWNIEGQVYLGLMYDELGRSDEAYGAYVAALSLNPRSAYSHGVLARHLLHRGAWREAVVAAKKALEHNPHAVEALQIQGRAEFQLGHYDAAESLLVRARGLRERDHLTALHLARLYLAREQWDLAARELGRAWLLRPDDEEVLLARIALERERGELASARRLLEQVREAHPASPRLGIEDVRLKIAEGRETEALARLTALAAGPGLSAEQRFQTALLFDRLGRPDAADRAFAAALEREPGNARYLYERGEMLLRAGRYDRAETVLRDLLRTYTSHADGYNALAWLRLQRDPADPAEALQLADLAVAVDSTRAYYHDTRAEALLRLGRADEAARAWREAARLDPDNEKYARAARDRHRGAGDRSAP